MFLIFSAGNITTHLLLPLPIRKLMQTTWSHNTTTGTLIGKLVTEPKLMDCIRNIKNESVASAFVLDNHNCKWRVRANDGMAHKLLSFSIGHKLRLTGVKGNLCAHAWDDARRQIVPSQIEEKITKTK